MGDDIEVHLKELRKQVEEDRESRIAYEEARTAESKAAEQKAADRAAEQAKQFDQMMRMMARLDQGRLEEEKQDGQSRETSAAGDEDEAPALPASGDSVVPVEVGPREDQPGESGQDRDYGLYGESTNDTPGGRRSFMTVMKMAPPVLKDRAGFPAFREKVKVFSKYNGFESVLTSDPPVDVGSTERVVLLRRGVPPGVYERQHRAWAYFSQAFEPLRT